MLALFNVLRISYSHHSLSIEPKNYVEVLKTKAFLIEETGN